MTGQPRRIGLMGCGTVADYGHIPAIQRTDGLSLHAIYHPSADALERTQKPHGIPEAFTDAGMFFDSGIEAVAIASPTPATKKTCCMRPDVVFQSSAKSRWPWIAARPPRWLRLQTRPACPCIRHFAIASAPAYLRFENCWHQRPSAMSVPFA